MKFPIGVMVESFRTDFGTALKLARQVGAQGIQMYASRGERTPDTLNASARRELLDRVKSEGLVFSALCGDFGKGFGVREQNAELIEKSKRVMDMAKELETDVVTTHIGVVPTDPNHDRYKIMQEACHELAEYADSLGGHFAIETGPETAATLKGFLDGLGSRGVAVNFDPANFVMVTGDDPVRGVRTLADYIVHTHAKDGRKLLDVPPEVIYGVVEPVDIEDVIAEGAAFEELPLGKGSVDFPGWLKALEEIGYKGFLTIEREVGADPTADITLAADTLRALMK